MEEFEKWFASLPKEVLDKRNIRANMFHAWEVSRMFLQSAQQSVQRTCATCGENYALTDFILGNGKHICGNCGASR